MSLLKATLLATVAVLGSPTVPDVERPPVQVCGQVTVYGHGSQWHGTHTATGERLDPQTSYTAAHRTLPFGTTVQIVSQDDGAGTWARINDRGPYMVEPEGGGPRSFHGTTLTPGMEWSNFLDVTPATAKAADLEGFERVCLRYWSTPRRPERWSSREHVHSVSFEE